MTFKEFVKREKVTKYDFYYSKAAYSYPCNYYAYTIWLDKVINDTEFIHYKYDYLNEDIFTQIIFEYETNNYIDEYAIQKIIYG